MNVKIINNSKHPLPEYKTKGSAGMDLTANLDKSITLKPMQRALIPTGLYTSVPEGYELQIRPRSGLALKHGITLANAVGTVDSDYRGEIGVILINLGDSNFTISDGDRIAQMVLAKYEKTSFIEVDILDETERNDGGFGHTGK